MPTFSTTGIANTGLSAVVSTKSPRVFTRGRLHYDSGGSITYQKDGSAKVVEKAWCGWEEVFGLIPPQYSAHPLFPTLLLDYQDLNVTRDGDFASLTMPYTGIINGGGGMPEPWTEFTPIDNATPIECLASPDVGRADLIGTWTPNGSGGGTWSNKAPLTSFAIDAQGNEQFKGWISPHPAAGAKSFYMPSGIFSRFYASPFAPTLSLDPEILATGDVPQMCYRADWSGRNWLRMPALIRRSGGYYSITEKYLLSNIGGWFTGFYDQGYIIPDDKGRNV